MRRTIQALREEVQKVTSTQAKKIGDEIGVDWKKVDLEQFRMGIEVEAEHDTDDPKTDVVKGRGMRAFVQYGKIALAHLREKKDYYTRLKKVE
jgi:hypothetical protein